MRMILALGVIGVLLPLLAGCGSDEESSRKPFKAGVASVKITPEKPGLYLGGWGMNRAFTKVHDDIYARALALQRGDTTVVWVSLDLVGLLEPDVSDIRRAVKDVPPQNVIICCSHVHSAPDTIGIWGPKDGVTGVNEPYRQFVKDRAAQAINQAVRGLKIARVKFAKTVAPPKTARNMVDPKIIDPQISILQVVDPGDEPIAVLVNWACHPEALDSHNLELTSDYVHWLRQVVEKKVGGTCVFLNGALGGMVSPDISEHSFKEGERVGTAVGEAVVKALQSAEGPLRPDLAIASQSVKIPVENEHLLQAMRAGIIPAYKGQKSAEVTADIAVMWLGPSVWMTMPGEPLPAVGLAARALTDADYKFVVGLANSEFGYILNKEAWGQKAYEYEMSMSMGPKTAGICVDALKKLMDGAPSWAKPKKPAAAGTKKPAAAKPAPPKPAGT
jgi:hypothetical protein